jgi:hypothetical protein
MMGIFKKAAILAGAFVFCLCALNAQQTGELRGKITEEKGEALPGVAILVKSPSLQGVRTALSDKNGNFRLPLLPVGQYALTFKLAGFEKLTLSAQEVRLGFTASINVILKVSTVSEEVTVNAPSPLIDKINTDNSFRWKAEDLAQLPTPARTIAEVVAFTPGVTGVRVNTLSGGASYPALDITDTGLPSFRGEGNVGNNWLVDGLSTKGVSTHDAGVRINYDAWEEVQIISDGFAPDLGQGVGGFVNVITKSGGNDFHGEIGGLIRDWHLRAPRQEQLSVASLPDSSKNQYFGNLGGPILKDKLWFFLSDNYFGNLDMTSEQSIGWLTIPAGLRRVGTNNAFGKLTFTPRVNHTLSLSGTLDKFLRQTGGIGVPETYTKAANTDYFYRLNYRSIFSPNTVLTATLGQDRRKRVWGPFSGDYGPASHFWQDIAQTTNNTDTGGLIVERRTNLAIGLIQFLDLGRWGTHEFRAGGDYYNNKVIEDWRFTGTDFDPYPGNGFDNGVMITWAAPGAPLQLMEVGAGVIKDSSDGLGFYVQDNIVISRFSLMFGLRTDMQRAFNDAGTKLWSWGIGDFLQPRASLSVDLTGNGRNVLKFSYGRFAMPVALLYLRYLNSAMGSAFRLYEWVGPEGPAKSDLKDGMNWSFFWEQSAAAMPIQVDPNLKPNHTDKLFVEFDRQIGTNWALKLRGVYSSSSNLLEDIALYDSVVPGSLKYLFTNFELKERNYKAFEVELNGKIGDGFRMYASYVWSQAKGTNPGDWWEWGTWSVPSGGNYDGGLFGEHPFVPEGAPDKEFIDTFFHGLGGRGVGDEGWYGFLPYSVDHVVKILGTYLAPFGLAVSSNMEYLSGYHWEKKGWSDYGSFFIYPEGRGGRTTPGHLYVDLAVQKDFRLRKGMSVGAGVNVYNLLNSQRPVSFMKEDNELFGQVWARQLPRWAQVKFLLKF